MTRFLALVAVLWLILGALALEAEKKEKLIYHIAFQGAEQLSCKIKQKATKANPYIIVSCDYRCPHPVSNALDFKQSENSLRESIICRDAEASTSWYGDEHGEVPAAKPKPEPSATDAIAGSDGGE